MPTTNPEDLHTRIERERQERLAAPRTLAVHVTLRASVRALPELLSGLGVGSVEPPWTLTGFEATELGDNDTPSADTDEGEVAHG